MNMRVRNILLLLILFVSFATAACDRGTGREAITGGTCVPSPEEINHYIEKHELLSGGISKTTSVPIRFVPYGPAFGMVMGKDASGQEKAVWLCENEKGEIELINSTLLADGLSEEEVRAKYQDRGPIKQIFLAPVDLLPDKGRKTIGWYIEFSLQERYVIVDFKTGEKLIGW